MYWHLQGNATALKIWPFSAEITLEIPGKLFLGDGGNLLSCIKTCDFQQLFFFTGLFGFKQFGVHINGYLNHSVQGLSMWIARRSFTKQTYPGKLDQMVSLLSLQWCQMLMPEVLYCRSVWFQAVWCPNQWLLKPFRAGSQYVDCTTVFHKADISWETWPNGESPITAVVSNVDAWSFMWS